MQNCVPNNSGPFVNSQLGVNNGNGPLYQPVDGKGDFVPPQAQQNQVLNSPGASKSQSNSGKFNGMNDRKNSWKKSHNTNFMNHKHNASQRGFGKQFHHQQNAQGNKFNNEHLGKGNKNAAMQNSNFPNSSKREAEESAEKAALVAKKQRLKKVLAKKKDESSSEDTSSESEEKPK